jgi:thymidylate synthase (FAD)
MELIKQSHKIWGRCPSDVQNALKWIERAGRVCYTSEDKITKDSALPFIQNLIERGHLSVLEHSEISIRMPWVSRYITNWDYSDDNIFMSSTGNLRAVMELYPTNDGKNIFFQGWLHSDFNDFIVQPPKECERYTVEFTTNRAMTHEIVRHRLCSFCISGDTLIHHFGRGNHTGKKRTIKQLYDYSTDQKRSSRIGLIRLTGMDAAGELIPVKIKTIIKSGIKEVFRLTTKSGRSIKATKEHRFHTPDGWKRLKELSAGSIIHANGVEIDRNYIEKRYLQDNVMRADLAAEIGMSDSWLGKKISQWGLQKPKSKYPNRQPGCGKKGAITDEGRRILSRNKEGEKNYFWKGGTSTWCDGRSVANKLYSILGKHCVCGSPAKERHHIDRNPMNNEEDNIEFLCHVCHKARHRDRTKIIFNDSVISIESVGYEETYDIEIDHPCHNFIANGLVVHNSQQSQRYIRYSSNGNKNPMQFIEPVDFQDWSDETKERFIGSCLLSEMYYAHLLNDGLKPQQARNVLSNACAARIVVTADREEWELIFKLRCGGGADPQMINLMTPVRDEMHLLWDSQL